MPISRGCTPTDEEPSPICTFGVSASKARGHVALIGDSHALHWRGPVGVVARAMGWRGYSISAPACPFSAAVQRLPVGLREDCVPWYRAVRAWFADHPEVSTVFVSQKARTPVVAPPGRSAQSVKIAGFQRAWRALPRTVKQIVVIRDVPVPARDMFECIERVVAAGTERPGVACATQRSQALRWDAAVSAANGLRSKRYRHVDMSNYFCSPRRCFPVIGGVQVHSDTLGHVTSSYGWTLGPYLLRKVRALRLSS
ncbi:MAG: SGNH hydrolase domain-containing protein [Solirubrobacteraceae bacterium]|nr:SGNH hydrolase domain-containing protein [Solirubrobacteraceae bacterium]